MYKYVKRLLDILLSILLIIIFLIPMLVVSLITLIDIGLPIIDIRLPREGKNKKPFYMYKIRTRIYDKEGNSSYSKISKKIDNLSLNELPQLFNILKGDMSFIGPRPFICNETLPNGDISDKRYLVRPGVFGLAQSRGGRTLPYLDTLKCDIEYYDNFSFILDLKIFINNIKLVIKRLFKR